MTDNSYKKYINDQNNKQMEEKLENFLNQEEEDNNPHLELDRFEVEMLLKHIKKSEKWDKLDERIGEFYNDKSGVYNEQDGDLLDIGEICALQLGYI